MRTWVFAALLAGLSAMTMGHTAYAAEIKVLSAGAMRGVVDALLPEFEKTTGHKVTVDNATAGVLAKRIEDGEAFDVAIITATVVDGLLAKGKLAAGSRFDLARVGMGVAVKAGAPLPISRRSMPSSARCWRRNRWPTSTRRQAAPPACSSSG